MHIEKIINQNYKMVNIKNKIDEIIKIPTNLDNSTGKSKKMQ